MITRKPRKRTTKGYTYQDLVRARQALSGASLATTAKFQAAADHVRAVERALGVSERSAVKQVHGSKGVPMATRKSKTNKSRKPAARKRVTKRPSTTSSRSTTAIKRCIADLAEYQFYVCYTTPPKGFYIARGYSDRLMANEYRAQLAEELPEGHAHTRGRKTLERTGVDPRKASSWRHPWAGAPRWSRPR